MIASQRNPDVLRAQKEIDAVGGRILQAGRITNPEFGTSWSETATNFNIADADERDLGIAQHFELPTKRSNRIDVAAHDRRIAELQLERIKTIVTARVQTAYARLLFHLEVVKNLEEQVKLLQDFLDLANAKLKPGSGSYLDVILHRFYHGCIVRDVRMPGDGAPSSFQPPMPLNVKIG